MGWACDGEIDGVGDWGQVEVMWDGEARREIRETRLAEGAEEHVKRGDTCWGRRRRGSPATHETDDDASSAAVRCGALHRIGVNKPLLARSCCRWYWAGPPLVSRLHRGRAVGPPKQMMDRAAKRQKGWLEDKSASIS